MVHQAEIFDPAMLEGDQHVEQEVHVAAGCPLWKCMLPTGPNPREKTQH